MKIRNKIIISASIYLGLIIILGFIVYPTYQDLTQTIEKGTLAKGIVNDVFQLNILRADYLLYSEERSKVQWFSKYESLGNKVKKAEEEEEEEWGVTVKNIRQNYDEFGPAFSELVKYKEGTTQSKELEARLVGLLLIKSQEIVSPAESLHNLAHAKIASSFKKIVLLIIVLITVFIILIINSFIMFNSILKPIIQLHKATEELEKGNFTVRADIQTKDELEQLGHAFNKTVVELEKVDEERKQIDKAKINFLSITSHELRSPMTPMKAQLQMVLQGYFGKMNKKQKESLEIVIKNTERLDKLIMDLLDISRIDAAKLKFTLVKTNLVSNIKNVLLEMKSFLPEKNITTISKIGKLPVIEVDQDKVMQVLRNLINNAIKFSNENSKVIVTVEKRSREILFSIQDFGIGIAKEAQARIFMPFFQEDQTMSRKVGGTGLGLVICKGIVEAMDGKIWFESEKGKGSTFYFTIPLKPKRG